MGKGGAVSLTSTSEVFGLNLTGLINHRLITSNYNKDFKALA
jgi:hypothetical protein